MEDLLSVDGIDEDSLDVIYEAVQSFVERKIETESDEEDTELPDIAQILTSSEDDDIDDKDSSDKTLENSEEIDESQEVKSEKTMENEDSLSEGVQ